MTCVIPVVLFHLGSTCSGGFVGVDVFFVISGYLITSLLRRHLEKGRFSLETFWCRRIRRLMPAMLLVVAVSGVLGWILFIPRDYEDFGRSVVALGLVLANVHFWKDVNHFAQSVDLKPILHTWSLATEERRKRRSRAWPPRCLASAPSR
jgi:peptidoglycan/LPS O-acetylase OafA/YrhL